MNLRRSVSTASLLLLLVPHLGACGDDDGSEGSAGDSTTVSDDEGAADDSGGQDSADYDVGDSAASDVPDPCSLLTVDQLADATGVTTFAEGEFNETLSGGDQSVCDWISDDPFATAQVLITPFGDSLDSQRASVEEAFDEPTVDVDLADGAYRTDEGSIVAMRVGALFVQVSYIPSGPGEVADATVQLAGNVVEALG